jgi:N-methylhydantoinase A
MRLSDFDAGKITALLADLKEEATGFVRTCDAERQILTEFKVYMRYTGQGWEIPIALTEDQATAPDAETFQTLFEAEYTKLFGRPVVGLDVEITVWSVNATTPPDEVTSIDAPHDRREAKTMGQRAVFDPAKSAYQQAAMVSHGDMEPGAVIQGPAVVTEDETTIIVPSSRQALCQPDGCIDLTLQTEEGQP